MAKAKTTKKTGAKKTAASKGTRAKATKTKATTTRAAKAKTKATKAKAKTTRATKAKTSKTKTSKTKPTEQEVPMDRRNPKPDRRGEDRRQDAVEIDTERREPQVARRKVARRRQIDPTTCERDYNNHEIEFMHALDAYKRAAGRMFPTCSEILEVIRDLGYRRLTPEEIAKLSPEPAEACEPKVTATMGTAEYDPTGEEQFEESLENFEV